MADYDISNVPRRVVYAPSGTGPYAFTFEILDDGDIAVYKGDTLLTLTTDYTVTINSNGTGFVTLTTSAGTSNITIVGSKTIARTTDFTTGGDFFANTLNDELDAQTIFIQQVAETAERGLKAPVTDPTDINMTLPRKADRAGKYLIFDAYGNPAPGEIPADVATVAANIADINAVADNEANIDTVASQITPTNNVATVAGISVNITTVAGISSNVTTVAGISSDVTAVAGNNADVSTVADNIADVQAVSPVAAGLGDIINSLPEINTVAADLDGANTIGTVSTNIGVVEIVGSDLGGSGFSYDLGLITVPATGPSASPDGYIVSVYNSLDDITAVAGDATDIGVVAGNTVNINTVAGISSNVTTVAGISSDVTSVAGNATNINTVATINTDVTAVASIAVDVTTVSIIASDVTDVANNATNIDAVAGISSNVTTVASIASDVSTVADNVADITNFADVYQGPKASAPTLRNDGSALQTGDLYFDTVLDEMRVRTSTATWESVSTNRTRNLYRYVATAGQTSFSGTDSNSNIMSYTAGQIDVYLNGVRLDQTDYTATNGTSVVLASSATLNDELNIVAFGSFDVANFNGSGLIDGTVSVAKLSTTLDLGSIA